MKVIESAIKLMKKGYVCDYCLGRAFGNLLTGKSNKERGEAIRQVLAMVFDSGENLDIDLSNFHGINLRNRKVEIEKKTCYFCNGIFEKIEEIAEKIIEKLKEYEFDTFLIGTKLSSELLQKEEEMIEEVGAEFYESLKSTLNREIGKIVERKTGKKANRDNPDVTVLVDLEKNTISLQVKSLFVYGEYQKLSRSIPQATWYCPYCKGKGCEKCKGTGLLYPTSVQMIIEKPLLKVTKGKKSKIHGCVAADTKILLSNNLSISIEELDSNWENYEILTFDINKKRVVPSKLADFVKINLNGTGLKVFEITTKETGRRIVATADHAFLTPKGMLPLSEIKVGDKVAVYPLETLIPQTKDEVIISEYNVLNTIQRLQPKLVFRTNVKKVIRELKERELLPLSTSNEKTLILARILGFLFGDGTVKLLKRGDVGLEFYGNLEDLREIKKDLKRLGYDSYLRREKKRGTSTVTNYFGKKSTLIPRHPIYRLVCNSKSLWFLIVSLGGPIGNKILQPLEVPAWIKKSDIRIKKEFLASLFGAEMNKPRLDKRKYNRKSFNSPTFSMNKVEELKENGVSFMNELRCLLKEFGIRTSEPKIIPYITRKDGKKTVKIRIVFHNNFENLLNLYGKIGFRYAKEKEILARYAYEYLLMKKHLIEIRKEIYRMALRLKKEGLTPKQIINKLNSKFVKYKNMAMWLSPSNKGKLFSNIKVTNDFPDFDEWFRNATRNLKNGLVWETIEEIKEVKTPQVFDITTRSKTHTFIANGFIVSNSGREDIDARCLAWRPFVIEIVKPKIRKIDLKDIEKKINKSKKVKVRKLKIIEDGKQLIRKLKTERSEKTYRAIVTFEKPIDKEKLKELKQLNGAIIFQKTPTRVLARRSDKERKRKVIKVSYRLINKRTLELIIRASAGLYIKELITGDNGRTKPNISEILNNTPKKILLDVIKIHRGE